MSKNNTSQPSYGDNFIPVVPSEQYLEHTEGRPFCTSDSCDCREDQDLIKDLNNQYQNGLASRSDVDRIYNGRTV